MGVRGLQSFLKNNPQLSQTIYLNNTKLVIDANNVLCCLYSNLCLDKNSPNFRCDLYGGNLVDYADVLRLFFDNLRKCKIEPVLVSDGSVIGNKNKEGQLASKDMTVYKRALDKFQAAKIATEDLRNQDHFQLSSLIGTIFRNIAKELNVERVQSPFEADTLLAQLANLYSCPVLTNDSDFIIYSLPCGFAMLDMFEFRNPTLYKGNYSIKCTIFSQVKLISCVPGLQLHTLPLISILLGNDFIEAGVFENFLNNIQTHSVRSSLVANTFSHRRIAALLFWLRNKSLDTAIRDVLQNFPPRDQNKINSTIRYYLNSYNLNDVEKLEEELEQIYPDSEANLIPKERPDLKPSSYLSKLARNKMLDPMTLDIVFHNTYYRYCQIDDFGLTSSSYVEYRIFCVMTALLKPRSYTTLTSSRRQVESEKDGFVNYDRVNQSYRMFVLKPMADLENFGSLDALNCYSMILLDHETKMSIIMATLRFNRDQQDLLIGVLSNVFCQDYLLESCTCFVLIRYIALETKLNPKPQFVDSLLLTLFYYATLAGQLNSNAYGQESDFGKILLSIRPHVLKNNNITYRTSESLFRRIVHFISQLKCAYRAYRMLVNLLDTNDQLHQPQLHKFFNGTLIFRLTELFRLGEMKMETLCQSMPSLLDASCSLKTIVHCDE